MPGLQARSLVGGLTPSLSPSLPLSKNNEGLKKIVAFSQFQVELIKLEAWLLPVMPYRLDLVLGPVLT